MTYKHQQVRTKKTKISTMLTRAAFRRGFEDYRAGRPFSDEIHDAADQWRYERGRQFACVYDGALRMGRTAHPAAIRALADAFQSRAMI